MADFGPSDPWYQALIARQGAGDGGGGTSQVAPPAPQPSAPQVQIIPGYVPDYASLIRNSGLYKQALAQNAADVKQAAANRTEVLRQLAIRYGGLPSGFKDQYGDINPDTLKLAGQNEQSDIQRLTRQYQDNITAAKQALAARHALGSGDLQWALDKANMAKESSLYDASNAFADAARNAVNQYLGQKQSAAAAEQQAMIAAAQAIYGNPAYAPTPTQYIYPPSTPTPTPAPSTPTPSAVNQYGTFGNWTSLLK